MVSSHRLFTYETGLSMKDSYPTGDEKIEAYKRGRTAYLSGYNECVSPYFDIATETILNKTLHMCWLLGFNEIKRAKDKQDIAFYLISAILIITFLIGLYYGTTKTN